MFNLFLKNDNKKISLKHLYFLYLVLSKHNKGLTFLQFCTYVNLFLNNFNTPNKVFLLLGNFFFLKTKKLKRCDNIGSINDVKQSNGLVVRLSNFLLHDFWNKFKKLKRPQTESTLNEFYVNNFKTHLTKYSNFGFLVLLDSSYFIRVKSENFTKSFVHFNKPLILKPKYSSSTISKYLFVDNLQEFEFQFLRKNKVYNKGRYSRCRQNYRTGVYMCMYLSVVSVFGLYYWFYKFSFNFTYLWWLFIVFVASFFLPKIIKYRLYEPAVCFSKFLSFFRWVFLIIKSFF